MVTAYDRFCAWAYRRVRASILPGLQNSQYAYLAALRDELGGGTGRWLDLGCGHGFLPDWMPQPDQRLDLASWRPVGVDLDALSLRRHPYLRLRVHGDVQRLPFAAGAFRLVTANMVVEHVREPQELFREISRVLEPNGTLLLHTPNVRGYTTRLSRLIPPFLVSRAAQFLLDRRTEDVYPTVYRANSAAELQSLASDAALTVSGVEYVNSSPQLIRLPLLMCAEVLWLRRVARPGNAELRPCLVARFTKTGDRPSHGE